MHVRGEDAEPHRNGRDHLLNSIRVFNDALWCKLEEITHTVRLLEEE